MATRYAMLDANNKVRRVTYQKKPHPDALPVIYPQSYLDGIDRIRYHIQQNPSDQWDVDLDNNEVTVTYTVTEKNLSEMKARKRESIHEQRKFKERDGTFFDDGSGNQVAVRTDSQTQSKIAAAIGYLEEQPSGTSIDWQRAPDAWATVDLSQLKLMANVIGNHVQQAFSRQRELEVSVGNASTHQEVYNIDVNSGWPESAGLAEDENL